MFPLLLTLRVNYRYEQVIMFHRKEEQTKNITCSKLTAETLEQGVKYVQS